MDKLIHLRYSCLLGFPQYSEVKTHNFCLRTADSSENTHYSMGYAPNKAGHNDKKSLLHLIFAEKNKNHSQLVLYGLKTILAISESY